MNLRSELNELNEISLEIFRKFKIEVEQHDIKLYDAEINVQQNSIITFQRNSQNNFSKDWIINEVFLKLRFQIFI